MKSIKYTSKYPNSVGLIEWSNEENQTWNKLISRQNNLTLQKASLKYIEGLERISFQTDKIPQHQDINKKLKNLSGWEVEIVPALIPAKEFFTLLANKKFPAASFIRVPEELDYIQEPDIFHEFYGHVPLLTFSDFSQFMQDFGKLALSIKPEDRRRLFRLFWFTVEFGLIKENSELKAYGGGILSSIHETSYSLDDPYPLREIFDVLKVLRTPYRIDIPQPLYYVIDSFNQLYSLLDSKLIATLEESKELGDLPPLFLPSTTNSEL
jgi:phenylalanine-4-hydroxylase